MSREVGWALVTGWRAAMRDGVTYLPKCPGAGVPIGRGETAICLCGIEFEVEFGRIPDHQQRPPDY